MPAELVGLTRTNIRSQLLRDKRPLSCAGDTVGQTPTCSHAIPRPITRKSPDPDQERAFRRASEIGAQVVSGFCRGGSVVPFRGCSRLAVGIHVSIGKATAPSSGWSCLSLPGACSTMLGSLLV